jgi:tyrosyl-tRNA synthetase
MLTAEEVKANAETYLRQFFMVVDRERTEIRWQSEWYDKFDLETVVRLAARFTVAQILQRDEYSQRFAAHKPIGLHEFLYPLLQAYDSVAVEADVEFGGTDQKFNLLVGRDLQEMMGQRPQQCFLVPLLVGTDGKVKMSKSLGNYIALEDPPQEMYGKVMSLPDDVMMDYYELVTDVPDKELAEIGEALRTRSVNPMEVKMRLAREIVTQFHSAEAAQAAEDEFTRVFRRRELPEESAQEVPLHFRGQSSAEFAIGLLIVEHCGLSRSEARRLIRQGAIEVDGVPLKGTSAVVGPGSTIRVGKRRFLRIVDADKQSQA